MGFFKKLAALFSGGGGGGSGDENAHRVYCRCNACGEPLAVRVDLRNDLSPEWESSSASGSDQPDYYTCRKVVVGRGRCVRPVEIVMRFGRGRRLESERAIGGTIMEREEYEQAVRAWEVKKRGDPGPTA